MCFFPVELGQSPVEELLSIRAVVIGTTQTLTREGRLTTERLGPAAGLPAQSMLRALSGLLRSVD